MNKRFNRDQGVGIRGQGPGVESTDFTGALPKILPGRSPVLPRYLLFGLIGLLLLAGCGKKLTPYAPDQVLPAPVRNFQLTQAGDALVLTWQLPRQNLLGQPLTQIQGCQVYRAVLRGVAPAALMSSDFALYADIDLAYPQRGEVRGESLRLEDRDLRPHHRYYYRVAAYGPDGHLGGWSRTLSHAWGWLPRPPGALKAVPGDKVVSLAWSPVARLQNGAPLRDLAGYLVYRLSGKEKGPWIQVTPAPVRQDKFQDVAVLNNVDYTYKVVAVRRLDGNLLASLASPTRRAMPEKTTPPPPVLNVLAVPSPQGVALRWEPSPAPDLAGYRIYRRQMGEIKYRRLNTELVKKPYFVDSQAKRGVTYYYYVTAVDNTPRANESLPSETAVVSY
jgi:hypothetical protein